METSQKLKILNFPYFQKSMSLIAEIFPNLGSPMSKKSRFRGPFDKQHGKLARTLLKSVLRHLYHIY